VSAACRVSFVVTSRNDDFGGDMLRRLRLFVENVSRLCERHALDSEIIVVEWNPPPGPRLHEVLKLRCGGPRTVVRFIEVPPALHHSLPNAGMLPLFQMIAKNVGLRRARGQFVLATNQDILFSDELIGWLARGPLDPDTLYRVDRTDVAAEVPEDAGVDEQLDWCLRRILRTHRRLGTFNGPPYSDLDWLRRIGLPLLRERIGNSPATAAQLAWQGLRAATRSLDAGTPRRGLEAMARWAWMTVRWAAKRLGLAAGLHTNACGDFTMLARERWLALRGYPEVPLYSLHIDSFFCYVAEAAGLREQVLRPPRRIFHLEHGNSWAVMDPAQRIEWFVRRPWLEYSLLTDLRKHMLAERRPYLYNSESWGFGGEQLAEVEIRASRVA
jgi:hypothetical protein